MQETQECVEFCDINNMLLEKCILKYQNNISRFTQADKIIENVVNNLNDGKYDTNRLDQGKNDIIEYGNMKIILTTTENQKNSNSIETSISLDECETILRDIYNISDNKRIYIMEINIIERGMKITKIEYEAYFKINQTKLCKLDLSYCKNSKLIIYNPVNISENIDKLNSSNRYYNYICYTSTSDYGTDII